MMFLSALTVVSCSKQDIKPTANTTSEPQWKSCRGDVIGDANDDGDDVNGSEITDPTDGSKPRPRKTNP